VRPENGIHERKIIKTTLMNSLDLNKFVLDNMQKNDTFYLMNKAFWNQWIVYSKSLKSKIPPDELAHCIDHEHNQDARFKIDN
jgi:hypothetical protein